MSEDFEKNRTDQVRSADEVARRCIVLHAVIAAGYNGPKDKLVDWLKREGLWETASPNEIFFLASKTSTQRQHVNATWRAEALLPLLWALGRIPELPFPTNRCDIQMMIASLPPVLGPVAEWLTEARLREESVIRDANETIYQIHWEVRDAQLNGKPVPNGYNPGVVQERHHALNWLIGYCGLDWDDITTDT